MKSSKSTKSTVAHGATRGPKTPTSTALQALPGTAFELREAESRQVDIRLTGSMRPETYARLAKLARNNGGLTLRAEAGRRRWVFRVETAAGAVVLHGPSGMLRITVRRPSLAPSAETSVVVRAAPGGFVDQSGDGRPRDYIPALLGAAIRELFGGADAVAQAQILATAGVRVTLRGRLWGRVDFRADDAVRRLERVLDGDAWSGGVTIGWAWIEGRAHRVVRE